MAGKAVATIDIGARPQLPDALRKRFDDSKNIQDRITVPSLSYEGKTWAISLNGDKTKLVKRDNDGDEVPLGVMRVVILDYAKRRGRAYYEGAYDPAKPGTPACWSTDGYVPDDEVKEKQNPVCESCPMAVKGSKMTEQGKAATACSQHRMIVVVPENNLEFTPLRLKLAITSDYDGQSSDHQAAGWFAFSNFTDMLRSKQVNHTAEIVTKMKFDPNTAFPKVLFSYDRWLKAEEMEVVGNIFDKPAVTSLLDGSWTPDGIGGTKKGAPKDQGKTIDGKATEIVSGADDDDPSPEALAAANAAAEKQKADEAKAKAKAERQAKAKEAAEEAARLAKAAEEDEDEGGEVVLPDANAKPAEKPAETKAAETKKTETKAETKDQPKASQQPSTKVPGDVADLLADWGGE